MRPNEENIPALSEQRGTVTAVPASRYSIEQLADLYNQARVDYIVPMPMNGKRMAEYVRDYDIDLDASAVALNEFQEEAGLIMTGLRGKRSWATRLGVIPSRRGRHIGQFLMERLLQESSKRGVSRVQLEVIRGNEPAIQLFLKLGFRPVRNLLVVRRPPSVPPADLAPSAEADIGVTELTSSQIEAHLRARDSSGVAWTEETASLLHVGNLAGLSVVMPNGEAGWIIFQRTAFQITHVVLSPGGDEDMAHALLYNLHKRFPMQDTKVENLPADHPAWPIFQRLGYLEVFARTEMSFQLAK